MSTLLGAHIIAHPAHRPPYDYPTDWLDWVERYISRAHPVFPEVHCLPYRLIVNSDGPKPHFQVSAETLVET